MRPMVKIVAGALLLATGFIAPTMADEMDSRLVNFINIGGLSTRNAEAATTAPKQVLDYCNWYLEKVPVLSPRERDWLDGEYKSQNGTRMIAATYSLEGIQSSLRTSAESCAGWAQSLINDKTPQSKLYHWVGLIQSLVDFRVGSGDVERLQKYGAKYASEAGFEMSLELQKVAALRLLQDFVLPLAKDNLR